MVNLPEMPENLPRSDPPTPGSDSRTGAAGGYVPRVSELADFTSAMTPRFNLLVRWFARRYFGHFDLDSDQVRQLQSLERRGSVVYVMRYSSRLDYLLFNTLFLREGVRLSSFANGIRFYGYKPLLEILRTLVLRKRGRSRAVEHSEDQDRVRGLTREGESFFLFLRTQRLRTFWRGLWNMRHRQDELDLLQEVVREVWTSDREAFVVPLAIFWRKGPRSAGRFLNLDYGSLSRPSDLAKMGSFLATYRKLQVKIGEPVDVLSYLSSHRDHGQARVARTIRRSILVYLYREEKVVEGPTLRSAQRVLKGILADAGVRGAMRERAAQKRGSPEKAEREVEKMFREIAARMNSTMLAALAAFVDKIVVKRLFSGIETRGLDRVAECAKRHPIVLVPTHRSYFDFVLISLLFYNSYLVPPHIAARDNMAFGPFGLIFRMAGAFYLRRSFDDPLYREIFRAYLVYLVREGFPQEFFIEGGRSRTGKSLVPRLGMLTWEVDAFLECSRKDLLFVPVAITYERLVEESGMVGELEGEKKTDESTLALFRSRKYLRSRFGSVHVNFGDPISLAESLGDRRERFERQVRGEVGTLASEATAQEIEALSERIAEEKRDFIDDLGYRIVEQLNWSVVANTTSVLSAVLMGTPHRGLLRSVLSERAQQIAELLRLQDTGITTALRANQSDWSDSVAFMLKSDLVKLTEDSRGEIIYFEESHRRALDIYRNSIVHYLAVPSFLARQLLRGATRKELEEDLAFWLEVLYREFFVPRSEATSRSADVVLEHFEAEGWITHSDDYLCAMPEGMDALRCLATQTAGVIESYEVVGRVVFEEAGEFTKKEFLAKAAAGFERASLLGLAGRSEAANDTTFGNALELLRARGILESTREPRKAGPPEVRYSPGEHWDALGELQERLASAISPD
ncbi:MAG: 1-acyl-sn-glycerol-3-phosphate acyltransferase [Deltaproteobacteria bacterium]|nr:1-acyl-sn-glycerol-3-phosphate acyltransferase [Deltaproteobacteria bacterium]MBW2382075.1 1-acyl-sn-glycerol-3-phosphate acyltransferase [Deltaproteobacteria bacterium]